MKTMISTMLCWGRKVWLPEKLQRLNRFALIMFLLLGGLPMADLIAQNAVTYPFESSVAPYNNIITVENRFPDIMLDDGFGSINLPTPFRVNGVLYTKAWMHSYGFLALYSSTPPVHGAWANTPLSATTANADVVIVPFGTPMRRRLDTYSGMFFKLVGSELVFEWAGYTRTNLTGVTENTQNMDNLTFQVRLDTESEAIKMQYYYIAPGVQVAQPQVGFRTSNSTDWQTNVFSLMLKDPGTPNGCKWDYAVSGIDNGTQSRMFWSSTRVQLLLPPA